MVLSGDCVNRLAGLEARSPLFTELPRRKILGNRASGDADSRKFKRLKTPQVACARELEPAPLDTQALPVWRYVLILPRGGPWPARASVHTSIVDEAAQAPPSPQPGEPSNPPAPDGLAPQRGPRGA